MVENLEEERPCCDRCGKPFQEDETVERTERGVYVVEDGEWVFEPFGGDPDVHAKCPDKIEKENTNEKDQVTLNSPNDRRTIPDSVL